MRTFNVKVNGVAYEVEIEEVGAVTAAQPEQGVPAPAPTAAPKAPAASAGGTAVKAPMPGNIVKINCKTGDGVKRGDVLCLLEAMKMENEIFAPCDGTVKAVEVSQGESVATDAVLFTIG